MQEIEENASHEFLGLTGLLYKVEEGRKNGVLGLSLQVSGDLVNEVRNVMKQKNLSDVMKFVVVLQRKKKKKIQILAHVLRFVRWKTTWRHLPGGPFRLHCKSFRHCGSHFEKQL